MTKLTLADLPPKVREQLEREQGVKPRTAKSRKGSSDRVLCPGVCGVCGERFDRYGGKGDPPSFVTHSQATDHRRWSIALD